MISRYLRLVQYACLFAGLGAMGVCVFFWAHAKVYQFRQARLFDRELHRARANPARRAVAPPPPPVLRDGTVVGRIEIPRLGLSTMVVEGVNDRDLSRAVGHIPGTPLPWQPGNVAIAGHRDTFFRPLRRIRRGDLITLRTLEGSFRYSVVSTTVVRPEDVWVLDSLSRKTLTLVTCYPFYYVGPAPERFVITAEQLSHPLTSPPA